MDETGKRRWDLTPRAFEHLLDRLSSDRLQAAAEYQQLRERLIAFFESRGSAHPDAQADATLDRVARKLREGERIEDVRRYVYGVARNLLLEWARRGERERVALSKLRAEPAAPEAAGTEEQAARVERCVAQLPAETQSLLADYYGGEGPHQIENRKRLAERLGITYGALKVRAHRARAVLEQLLRGLLGEEEK